VHAADIEASVAAVCIRRLPSRIATSIELIGKQSVKIVVSDAQAAGHAQPGRLRHRDQ